MPLICAEDLPARPTESLGICVGSVQVPLAVLTSPARRFGPSETHASRRTGHGKGLQQSVPQPLPPAQGHPREPHTPGRRQEQQQDGELQRGRQGHREKAMKVDRAARLVRNRRHVYPPQRRAPHGHGGHVAVRQDGDDNRRDSRRVTLIQNAAMARVESKTKRMRHNADKNRRNARKAQKVKKARNCRSRQVPRAPAAPTARRSPGG